MDTSCNKITAFTGQEQTLADVDTSVSFMPRVIHQRGGTQQQVYYVGTLGVIL